MQQKIPKSEKLKFKEKFLERYDKLTNLDRFLDYSLRFLKRSIRVNTIKSSVVELKQRLTDWKLTQIPWCKEGFWIEHKKEDRRDIGNLIEHTLGYFYVQEALSMIPPIALDPKPHEIILDMCASPGSKTTQLSALMENKGIVVANDNDYTRLKALSINLQRCGSSNVIMTLMEGRSFKNIEFDKILLDAPCSGVGNIRKSIKTIKMWNPNMVKRLTIVQKQLISTAFNALKEDGTLVYSTCTLEPEENEGIIDFLLEKYDAKVEKINININSSPAILEFEGKKYKEDIKNCLRIWPQDNDTGGFFVAKLKRL